MPQGSNDREGRNPDDLWSQHSHRHMGAYTPPPTQRLRIQCYCNVCNIGVFEYQDRLVYILKNFNFIEQKMLQKSSLNLNHLQRTFLWWSIYIVPILAYVLKKRAPNCLLNCYGYVHRLTSQSVKSKYSAINGTVLSQRGLLLNKCYLKPGNCN